jgi:hypothetical protein
LLVTGEHENGTNENIHEATYMCGHPSAVVIPSFQGGYTNVTIPDFNMYVSSSGIDASAVKGGYTSLLLGVDQDATSAVRKLHFDSVPNNENI